MDKHAWAFFVLLLKGFSAASLKLAYSYFMLDKDHTFVLLLVLFIWVLKKYPWMVQHAKLPLLLLFLNFKKQINKKRINK